MRTVYDPLYYAYHLIKTNYGDLWSFLSYSSSRTARSRIKILLDCLWSVWRYEISLIDYFQFRFFEMKRSHRANWAGTTFMYKSQSKLNSKAAREVFRNKTKFYETFPGFVDQRRFLVSSRSDISAFSEWLNKMGFNRVVVKPINGQCGVGVSVNTVYRKGSSSLIGSERVEEFVIKQGTPFICEAYLENHKSIRKINPECLNTLRLVTWVNKHGEASILAGRMRFGRRSVV